MSFLAPATNYLGVKVEVEYESDGVVDMIGSANSGTSYSLLAHVVLSVPSLPAGPLRSRRREVRDLTVTMEGMAEYMDEQGRYTPMRLHSHSITLASPQDPIILPSHDVCRPHDNRLRISVPFDLRIPGWLPASHSSIMSTVQYGLVASATLGWEHEKSAPLHASLPPSLNPSRHSEEDTVGWSWLDSMEGIETSTPFRRPVTRSTRMRFDGIFTGGSTASRSTTSASSKYTPFTVNRHLIPDAIPSHHDRVNQRSFTLKPEADSPLECIVVLPDWVDLHAEDRNIKVGMRIRARSPQEKEEASEESIPAVAPNSVPSRRHSMPVASSAPREGSDPLTASTGVSVPMERDQAAVDDFTVNLVEIGMEVEEVERFTSTVPQFWTQTFPIPAIQPNRSGTIHPLLCPRSPWADAGANLHNDARPIRTLRTRKCLLADDGSQRNFLFEGSGLALGERWRKVNIVLPMPETLAQRPHRPQGEYDGPFARIRHQLKIKLVSKKPGPGADQKVRVVVISAPIRFGTQPTTSTPPSIPRLPAYVQLFQENGDPRECDPLPLYTPGHPPTYATAPGEDVIMEDSTASSAENAKPAPSGPATPAPPPIPPFASLPVRRSVSEQIPSSPLSQPSSRASTPSEADTESSLDDTERGPMSRRASSIGSSGSESGGEGEGEGGDGMEVDSSAALRGTRGQQRERDARSQAPPPTNAGGRGQGKRVARSSRSVRAVV